MQGESTLFSYGSYAAAAILYILTCLRRDNSDIHASAQLLGGGEALRDHFKLCFTAFALLPSQQASQTHKEEQVAHSDKACFSFFQPSTEPM